MKLHVAYPDRARIVPLLLFALTLAVLASGLTAGVAVNNGDFSRVFGSMGIEVPGWTPLDRTYPFISTGPTAWPASTMGAFGWLAAEAQRLGGREQFATSVLTALLATIYLGGCLALTYRPSRHSMIALSAVCLSTLTWSFYFRSLYEEAAVLALVPMFAWGILKLYEGRVFPFFLISMLLLVAKAQMIFLLPLLGLMLATSPAVRYSKAALVTGLLTVLAAAYGGYSARSSGMAPVNDYNRLYNGVGWSLQGVNGWPAHEFNARMHYFAANKAKLQQKTVSDEPTHRHLLLGTSYWPTGAELSTWAWQNAADSSRRIDVNEVFGKGRLPYYASYLLAHPKAAIAIAWRAPVTALTADYSLAYIRHGSSQSSFLSSFIADAAFIYPAVALTCIVVALGLFGTKATFTGGAYFILGAPLFVVVGDGYFEFEKHLAPYLMLIPGLITWISVAGPHRDELAPRCHAPSD